MLSAILVMDMTLFEFLLFVIAGCGVGFLGGLFGIGGGFILVPILIFSYEHSGVSPSVLTHMAIGTSLFVILFLSLSSSYQQSRQRNIDWRPVCMIGFSSAFSAFATTRLAAELSGQYLRIAFTLLVFFVAIRMLTEGELRAQKRLELPSRLGPIRLLGVGFTTGIVSALAGIGGGVILIPMMYYFLNMPLKLVVGTSSAAIIITAFSSVAGYAMNGIGRAHLPPWSFGFIDLQRGIALSIGSILLARVGAYVSFKIHPYRLRKLFALFIIFIAVYILVK
jgi:uncharacterized membrane protein YfcA